MNDKLSISEMIAIARDICDISDNIKRIIQKNAIRRGVEIPILEIGSSHKRLDNLINSMPVVNEQISI